MRGEKSEDQISCSGCGHAATQHSNEACEAIRCSCRVTRKVLAARSVSRSKPLEPSVEPAKRQRTRTRRKVDGPAADGTQAA